MTPSKLYSMKLHTPAMRLRWQGHSCFEFDDGTRTVVIDPHDGKSIGIKPPFATANVVLMTHNHYDHNVARIIRGTHKDFLSTEGYFDAAGMEFEGILTCHDAAGGEERGFNIMYQFTMDGMRFCHCGDIGSIPDKNVIERIKGCDMLFIPTGEVITMEMDDVKRFIELVNPNIIVPMHYRVGGLTLPIHSIDAFLDIIPEDAVDYVGNEIEFTRDDITDLKECWIFDR